MGCNALHLAAKDGHINTIAYLAPRMQSLLHNTDNSGATMLHWAAVGGHVEVVRHVIEQYKMDPAAHDEVCTLDLWAQRHS